MTLAQRKVQASYYRRLAREGHALDDVVRLKNDTFADLGIAGRRGDHVSYECLNALEVDGTVWDTPVAAWWRTVSARANALPRTYPRRRFLVAWASSGELLASARSVGLTKKAGRYAVRKFLRRERLNVREAR